MRIGIISTMAGNPWGGSEDLWSTMARRALENGIKVSVCFLQPKSNHEKWTELEKIGADLFSWRSDTRVLRHLIDRAQFISYRISTYVRYGMPLEAFFRTEPDVVLINETHSLPAIEFLNHLRPHLARTPYVTLNHTNTGAISHDPERRSAEEFYQGAHSTLFVSEDSKRETERLLLTRLQKSKIVRNPVNLSSLDVVDWPAQLPPTFACVGRLEARDKGQDILLQVLADDRWRQRDWRLSIYGTGPNGTYFKEFSAFVGLEDRVSFHGHIRDIQSIWKTHHALLMPSRAEGLPLALVEAMICGRPAIATPVAGIPEWIRDGHNGFLAVAPTVTAFATALDRAWERRSDWPIMGRVASEDALRLYDPAPGDTLLSIMTEAAAFRAPVAGLAGR